MAQKSLGVDILSWDFDHEKKNTKKPEIFPA